MLILSFSSPKPLMLSWIVEHYIRSQGPLLRLLQGEFAFLVLVSLPLASTLRLDELSN
jgi:hypothetical protein